MLNHITIMGRLVRDPELRYTQTQIPVASFTVAVDRDYAGQGQERGCDFISCVAWRQGAEFVGKYFRQGSMIVVDGRLESRKWQDRDGNNRVSWEINASRTYFGEAKRDQQGYQQAGNPVNVYPGAEMNAMDGPGDGNPFVGQQQAQQYGQQAGMFDDLNDGELPF